MKTSGLAALTKVMKGSGGGQMEAHGSSLTGLLGSPLVHHGLAIGKKEDCLMMDFSKGAWNDDACSSLQLPSFCSQPICFGKFS